MHSAMIHCQCILGFIIVALIAMRDCSSTIVSPIESHYASFRIGLINYVTQFELQLDRQPGGKYKLPEAALHLTGERLESDSRNALIISHSSWSEFCKAFDAFQPITHSRYQLSFNLKVRRHTVFKTTVL